MKQRLLLLLLLLASWSAQAQTLLQQQSFEGTGTDAATANGYTATALATNGNQYFLRTTLPVAGFNTGSGQVSTVNAINGSYFWASENVRRDLATGTIRGLPAANVTLNALNVAGKSNLSVTVALADASGPATGSTSTDPEGTGGNTVLRWETDDYVRVQYNLDNAGWVTIGQFVGDDPGTAGASGRLRQDANRDGISNYNIEPNSPILTQTLTDYTFAIPGSGASLQVRVQIDQDGASEEFGFDNIRVYGSAAASAAPVLGNIEGSPLAYNEGQGAAQITNNLTITDDGTTMNGASVAISTNYQASEDELLFTTQNGISGNFNTTTGVLTLSGTSTLANYQTALRSIQYRDNDANDASPLTRTISFNVTDATGVSSNTVTRNITVTTALDPAYVGLPYVETFENPDGEGTRYASNHFFTQNGAQFQRTNTPTIPGGTTFTNIAGSYYWVGANTNANTGLNPTGTFNGTVTTKQINTAGYTNLGFQIRVGASTSTTAGSGPNWKTSDYFQLRYRTAGSSTWTAFGLFRGTNPAITGSGVIRQDTNPNGTGAPTGTQLTEALQNFTFSLPAALNGQTLEFQMLAVISDGNNLLAFDQIQVTGTPATTVNSIVRASTNPTNAATVNYTVTFGAPVTGLTASNFTLTPTGSISSYSVGTPVSTGTGSTWTVPVNTGSGDGTLTLNLANDNNLSVDITTTLPFAGETYTIDKTAPSAPVVTVPANGSVVATATPTYSGTAEANSTVTVIVDGSPLSGTVTANASGNWTKAQPTALSQGSHTVRATATDAVGNTSAQGAANTFTVDTTPPSAPVVTTPANGSTVATTTPTYTGTAEANSTVTVIVDGSPLSGTTSANASGNWSLTQPTALGQGSHTVRATATDAAGNTSPNSGTNTFTVDTVAPTVNISSGAGSNGGTTNTTPIPFTVTFSEGVNGFVQGDLQVTGGTIVTGSFSGASGSSTYTFNVTPTGSTVTVNIAANVAQDAAGNNNTAASQFSLTYQQPLVATAQNVTVNLDANGNATLNASSVNNGSTGSGTLTYTIQKIVYGRVSETNTLTLSTPNGANFLGTNAIRFASYGRPIDNGNGSYAVDNSCNAANSVTTAQNSFGGRSTGSMDASNGVTANNNPALGDPCPGTPKFLAVQAAYSANAASLTYDCTEANKTQYVLLTVSNGSSTSTSVAQVTVNPAPTATITNVNPNSAQRGTQVTVSGTNLSGLTSLTVGGTTATISNLTANGFTFVVPNTAAIGAGNLTITAPCSQTLRPAFSVTAPALSATVSTTSASPTSNAPIPFSVTFSQSVGSTFVASDVTVSGGTLTSGSFSGSGSGPYTFTVTPSGTGTVSVSVAAGVVTDANNTGNTASNTVSVQYNQPVTATPRLNAPANGSFVAAFTPTYSGTAPSGSTVTVYVDGTAIGTTTSNGSFSLTQPTALSQGSHTVYATAQLSGQAVSANSNTNTFIVDTVAPTVTLSSSTVTNGGTTTTSPLSFTATFSETVANFSAAGLTVTNGTVTSGPTAGSGNAYTFQVTPSAGGTVTVQVRANAAQDQAINGNTASGIYSLTFAAPTILVGPTALTSGQQGVAYSQALSASGGTAPYTYAITSGALPSGLSLTNGTISGTPTVNGTFSFTVTATDASAAPGPYSGARTYSLVIAAPAVTSVGWTGNTSTDWFTASNWSPNQVPDATIDAVIPTAPSGNRFPIIAANALQANARNVSIATGATLSMSANTLTIAANLTTNGIFNGFVGSGSTATGGTVALGGSALSLLNGGGVNRFWNLTVGASGAQLNNTNATSVQRLLTLNGNLATNSNPLTLLSNAIGTALVVNNGSSVVNGTVAVQRAIDPSVNPGLGYRHYSAPVSNSTVGDLATTAAGGSFAPVVNPTYNTSATPTAETPFPTVFGYDESRTLLSNNLNNFDKGYFSPSALSDALTPGRGYTVNISASQLVDFVGTLNNGDLPLSLTSNRATNADAGWHLMGNPYPAPLSYNLVAAADRLNLEGAMYVFSSSTQYGGTYRSYNNGFGDPVLPVAQGFFVRVASGATSGSLTFRNSQRLTAPSTTTFQRSAETRPVVQLTLRGTGSPLTDEAYVYFQAGATAGFDAEFDATKLANPSGLNLSSQGPGQLFSIDGQPELGTAQRVVPLAIGVPAAGSYTLTASQLLNLRTVPTYLRDKQTGALVDLAQQPSYTFSVSNSTTLVQGRFELVFSPQQVLATTPAALAEQVGLYPNPATSQVAIELPAALGRQAVTVSLVDAVGRTVRTQVLPAGRASHTLPLNELATGVYSLRLHTEAGVLVKKLVIE